MAKPARRILVFRIGSIGDFVVALPCFHLIRQCYPDSEIVLMTNEPGSDRIVPAEGVLQGSGLVDRYIKYSGGTREVDKLWRIRKEIQTLAPEVLVYLAPSRGLFSAYRDFLFFWGAGVRCMYGLPLTPGRIKSHAPGPHEDLWESEAHRLGRQLELLGEIDFSLERSWDLKLSNSEIYEGAKILDECFPTDPSGTKRRVFGLSIGTKQTINDWGDANWRVVLQALGRLDFGLVLYGGAEDALRSQKLAEGWPGRVLNVCGKVSPRVSAAMLMHMRAFLCHDSGPMHLAAAVGTTCVAVFSRLNPPGIWFPFGSRHKILYPTSKSGTIYEIRPQQVIAAAVEVLKMPGTDVGGQSSSQLSSLDVRH